MASRITGRNDKNNKKETETERNYFICVLTVRPVCVCVYTPHRHHHHTGAFIMDGVELFHRRVCLCIVPSGAYCHQLKVQRADKLIRDSFGVNEQRIFWCRVGVEVSRTLHFMAVSS
ncbi:hypothetical protein CEXT_36101 [Caerostris extrusa]|uniref:Uncharacterized protein n=1 Tax=Caerostris extrusa TaxID=172846 RepID=A0AAV4ME68_CAEEX|nr:hypothetical protein CEXT_36101 [Caerostris extrusa]